MDKEDALAVTLFVLTMIVFLLLYGVAMTPDVLTDYDVNITNLMDGESFSVMPFSERQESLEFTATFTSDDIFLISGDTEIIAQKSPDGLYYYHGQMASGNWKVAEGNWITMTAESSDPLRVSIDRGFYNEAGLMLMLLILYAFCCFVAIYYYSL